MPDNLPELRDIHLPDGISLFPPAYGWWVIVGAIIGSVLFYRLIRLMLQKSKKRYALRLLKTPADNNFIHQASAMSTILRRICIYKYPEAIVLTGKQWTDFLNSKCKEKLDDKTADLLHDDSDAFLHGRKCAECADRGRAYAGERNHFSGAGRCAVCTASKIQR